MFFLAYYWLEGKEPPKSDRTQTILGGIDGAMSVVILYAMLKYPFFWLGVAGGILLVVNFYLYYPMKFKGVMKTIEGEK